MILNNNINNIKNEYLNLIQYAMTKGNKNKVENILRSLLFFITSTPILSNNFKFEDIKKAISYTTPTMGVTVRRRGSQNVYVPLKIVPIRCKFLSSKWIITHARLKTNKSFYKSLAEEIVNSSNRTSLSSKKRDDLHELSISSCKDINKKKRKKRVVKSLLSKILKKRWVLHKIDRWKKRTFKKRLRTNITYSMNNYILKIKNN